VRVCAKYKLRTDYDDVCKEDECYVQVQFEGATGTVAFDSYGRRRNYRLDVLEHRLDNEMFKVPSSNHDAFLTSNN